MLTNIGETLFANAKGNTEGSLVNFIEDLYIYGRGLCNAVALESGLRIRYPQPAHQFWRKKFRLLHEVCKTPVETIRQPPSMNLGLVLSEVEG